MAAKEREATRQLLIGSRALAADGDPHAPLAGAFALSDVHANAGGKRVPSGPRACGSHQRSHGRSPGRGLFVFLQRLGFPRVPASLTLREQPFPLDGPSRGDVRCSREQGACCSGW